MSDITIAYSNNISSNANKYAVTEKAVTTDTDTKKVAEDQKTAKQDENVSLSAQKRADNEKLQESTVKAKEQEKEVSKAVQERNEKLAKERMYALNRQNIGLDFSIDKDNNDTIVKVTDLNTKKLVRQIPSEEFLKMSERLDDLKSMTGLSPEDKQSIAKGILFDEKA